MIGIIRQRAHIAGVYIQQEVIVPSAVSESTVRSGIAVNKNDADLPPALAKDIGGSERTTMAGTHNRNNLPAREQRHS